MEEHEATSGANTDAEGGQRYRNIFRLLSVAISTGRPLPSLNAKEREMVQRKAQEVILEMPGGDPPPVAKEILALHHWDYCEFGSDGRVSRALEWRGHFCGPIFSAVHGWNWNRHDHLNSMKHLIFTYKPRVLMGWIDSKL